MGRVPGFGPGLFGRLNSVKAPDVVTRPMRPLVGSVNQSAPSGPLVIELGDRPPGKGKSVSDPDVVMRPTWPDSVNHSAPSGPVVMLAGNRYVPGSGNSVVVPALAAAKEKPPSGLIATSAATSGNS